MGKTCKVVVCGPSATGKTALLEQLIYGNHIVGAVSNPVFVTFCNTGARHYLYHIEKR